MHVEVFDGDGFYPRVASVRRPMVKASDGESTYSQRAQRQCAESGGPYRGTADGELGNLGGVCHGKPRPIILRNRS